MLPRFSRRCYRLCALCWHAMSFCRATC